MLKKKTCDFILRCKKNIRDNKLGEKSLKYFYFYILLLCVCLSLFYLFCDLIIFFFFLFLFIYSILLYTYEDIKSVFEEKKVSGIKSREALETMYKKNGIELSEKDFNRAFKRYIEDQEKLPPFSFLERFMVYFRSSLNWHIDDLFEFFTNPKKMFVFLVTLPMYIVIFLIRPLFLIFIWYPYWIIKLTYYVFLDNINEIKLNMETTEGQMQFLYLNMVITRDLEEVLKEVLDEINDNGKLSISKYNRMLRFFLEVFLLRINGYSYINLYKILYTLLGKLSFLKSKSSFLVRVLTLVLIYIYLFLYILVVDILLLPYHILFALYDDSNGYLAAYNKGTTVDNVVSYLSWSKHHYIRRLLGFPEYNAMKYIYKSDDKMFNCIEKLEL